MTMPEATQVIFWWDEDEDRWEGPGRGPIEARGA
jgi:hypothetical protein